MKIQKIEIRNFRCFDMVSINLHPDVNVFVGNNGSGKSAILDAISGALFPYVKKMAHLGNRHLEKSPFEESDLRVAELASHEMSLGMETENDLGWRATYYSDKRSQRTLLSMENTELGDLYRMIEGASFQEEITVVACYGGDRNVRGLADVSSVKNRKFNRYGSFANALNASTSYDDVAEWFFFREVEELREAKRRGNFEFQLPDLEQVRRAISQLIKPASRVFFKQEDKATLMVEWNADDGQKRELRLSQLSDGYRNMLALVMDFSRRMSQANPHLKNPLAGPGILLIDEIDLHLHPTWQQRVIPDLREVFPNTQIIVTTHSPEVVTTVKRGHVKVLGDFEVYTCPTPTYGMRTSDVVRSVLGLEQLRPVNEVANLIAELFLAIDRNQLEDAKNIRNKLMDWDPDGYDPDLTRANMRIRRMEQNGE